MTKIKLKSEVIKRAAEILKVLGHPKRLKIIYFLENGEKNVTQIQNHIDLIQAVTSQHMRLMLKKEIVTYRREGTTLFYRIADDFVTSLLKCMEKCDTLNQYENDID